jgi:hypothetical protein
MSSRAAEFASAILIGVLVGVFAGAYLITMPYGAADDCLTEPKGNTPQGQHWYYRIDRGTKRHCWYLRGEIEKSTRVASSERSSSAKAASRKQDGAQRSIADAHAELSSRSGIEDDTSAIAARPALAPVIPNAAAAAANAAVADDNNAGSNVTSRWPEPAGVNNSGGNSPADNPPPEASATTVVAAAQVDPAPAATATQAPVIAESSAASVPATPATAPASPAVAATPIGKYSGSLQELMIVAFAALALAGLSGSAVYRLSRVGRSKRRYDASRRSADWQQPRKKSRRARPLDPPVDPQPVNTKAQSYAHSPDVAPQPDFAPEEPRFASQPAAYEQHAYEQPASYERPEYEPVSEYAPKRRPTAPRRTRELEESFESIEQLLIRLAR